MEDWHKYVAERYKKGEYGFDRLVRETGIARTTIRRYVGKGPNIQVKDIPVKTQPSILQLIQKGTTIEEMMKRTGGSERVVRANIDDLRDHGYLIDEVGDRIGLARVVNATSGRVVTKDWNGDKVIRFGLCGDNQDNSKYTQITYLHNFYDILQSEGITDVYHTGDIDDGEKMRPGHEYEVYSQGIDNHIKNIVKNYPQRNGITTHFLTGNHDHSLIKHVGYDIGYPIAEKRPDMKYLGPSYATVQLTPNCTLELRHPIDGTAYAISYKIQKMIESLSGGEKPSILAVGHYHKAEYIFYRNVHSIQTGCFQAQSDWMRGKGISAHMGGWIIEVHVDEEGTITRFTPTFIPYYKAIKDDYRNWV